MAQFSVKVASYKFVACFKLNSLKLKCVHEH